MKQRFRNKAFVASLLSVVVAFIYQVLGLCGVVAPISQEDAIQVIGIIINLLAGVGVFINPLTPGITDKK